MRSASRVNDGKERLVTRLSRPKRTEDLSRGRIERANVDTSNGASVNVDAIDSAREVHPTTHNSGGVLEARRFG